MLYPEIKLSHSSSTNFCSKQLWYKKLGGAEFRYNFYSGAGTMVDAGYESGLKNITTGIEGCNIRKTMEESLASMEDKMDYPEFTKLAGTLDEHVQAVEDDMQWINYKPLETQYFFKIQFDNHTRVTTGYMDIVAERQDLPLIIDVKRQSKPAKKAKREWILQGALYAIVLMKHRNLTQIPAFENHLIIPNQPPVFLKTELTAEHLYMAYNMLTELNDRIDKDYWPLNRSHALCQSMWCDVYDRCHYENFIGVDDIVDRIT